jgi:hypothetical protein
MNDKWVQAILPLAFSRNDPNNDKDHEVRPGGYINIRETPQNSPNT